jgi:(4-O-methyl)-D-glucuronate---lignin esterase
LATATWPAVGEPVLGRVSYHVRRGEHSVTDFDWEQYLRFCNAWVKAGTGGR